MGAHRAPLLAQCVVWHAAAASLTGPCRPLRALIMIFPSVWHRSAGQWYAGAEMVQT
jgi:hypothetical protein